MHQARLAVLRELDLSDDIAGRVFLDGYLNVGECAAEGRVAARPVLVVAAVVDDTTRHPKASRIASAL